MIVLDAGALIAQLDAADVRDGAAVGVLSTTAEPLAQSALTLAEVLVGPVRVGRLAEAQTVLDALGLVTVPMSEQASVRLARLRVSSGLRLPECCVLEVAVHAGASLATFDPRLASAARQLGVRVLGDPAA